MGPNSGSGSGSGGPVVVDGITVTGTGVEGDPLVAPGAGDSLVLVADTLNVVEDTPTAFDLFANDLPLGEWEVHGFRVPSATVGEPPVEHYPSATAVSIAGYGSIVIGIDGVGTYTPAVNAHGAVPSLLVVGRGPLGALRYSTLAITVTPVNDPPTARDVAGVSIDNEGILSTATVDLWGAISDPDGDAVTLTLINGAAVVYDAPIALTGGTMTIDGLTGLATITPTPGRVDPIGATYTCSDGTLTSEGAITVIIAEVVNSTMYSPIAPSNPGNVQDAQRVAFGPTLLQEYGPEWPNIGPPDEEGNATVVTVPPYSSGQGLYDLANREPWLYNRVRTAYLFYVATQDVGYRDVAIEWAELYMANVVISGGNGTFTIIGNTGGDAQDVKYLYGEIALIYQKLTGSTVYYPQAIALHNQALISFPAAYNASSAELWTERNAGYRLANNLAAYYASGGTQIYLDTATELVDLILDMSLASGAPLHQKNKHEGDADTTDITSPWMSALLVEYMLQYFRITRSVPVQQWIYDYCVFVVEHGLYLADHNEEPEFAGLAGLRIPAYLFGVVTQYAEGTAADVRHSRDTASMLNKGVWAGTELALNTAALELARDELFAAALVDDAYWTRLTPFYPHHRFNPARSSGWLWGTYYALIYDTGAAPPISPVLLVEGVISGSTQQGQTLTYTPGVYGGTPAPTETWVWQLAGVNIVGTENDLAYATAAIGATTVHVTLTNEAGAVVFDTNAITVVPAGAPEITVQPTGEAGEVAAQVVFTCSFTGDPTPTAVVQLDTGGGFVTTATGTLVHDTVGLTTTATWTTPALTAPDDGTLVRFRVNNGVGGNIDSTSAALSVISQQVAVRVAGITASVSVAAAVGTAGFLDWTWCGWLYLETAANLAYVMTFEGVAGRQALLADENGTMELSIGDSNTGVGTGWVTPPPQDTWLWVTFRGPAAWPGVFTATYRAQGDGTTHTMTRANGIENSVLPLTHILGGGGGAGSTVLGQHMRAFNARLSDQACIDEQFNYVPTAGAPAFFVVAQDNGVGGVTVVDLSGNAATVTVTNGTLSASGPLTGSIA